MYKKVLAFVVVVALLAVGFGVASQPSVAQMKIVYNSYASDPVPRAYTEKVVAEWNAANPNMPVELNIINHEDFKQAIRTYLVADPPRCVGLVRGQPRAVLHLARLDRGLQRRLGSRGLG